ncbi:MAG: TonB-dependent receptor plug domain-containing protein [Gemmatimonadales bacterium]
MILLALLLAFPLAAAAQQRPDTASLPEIVVTANRYPVTADSVAATVTVLRGEELRERGIRFVSDALREVPGVQVSQGGSWGATTSLFVRGGESDYVKVLVDGVPVNQPGGSYDFASLTTDNVDRIEVLRGPGSVLYGSDAIAGVVQIVTREGSGPARVDAGGEAGSFGSARWEVGALGGSERLGWSGSLSRLTTNGTYAFNNDYRNTVASGRFRVRPAERTGITFAGRYGNGVFHFPTDFAGALVDRNQFNTEESLTLSLDLAHRFSGAVEGQLLVGRGTVSNGFENRPDAAPGPDTFGSDRTDTRRWTVDARSQLALPAGVRGLAGVSFDAQRQETSTRLDESQPLLPTGPAPERANWGFYLQASALPLRRLQLTAGGRLDRNQRFGSFWTYRANALAFAAAATRLRGSVGTGFKEPTFFDNFAVGFARGNPDLRPERSFSVEGGIEQDLAAGRVALSLTGFIQRFRDLIQFTFEAPTPESPNFFNVAGANASGVEVTVRARPAGPLEATVSYTRLSTEVTDAGFDTGAGATFAEGERLLRRPRDAFTLGLQSAWEGRGRVGAVLNYVGSRDDLLFDTFPATRVELSGYGTLDLSGSVTVLGRRSGSAALEVTARVENLLDHDYQQAAAYPARGRAIFVGVASHVP